MRFCYFPAQESDHPGFSHPLPKDPAAVAANHAKGERQRKAKEDRRRRRGPAAARKMRRERRRESDTETTAEDEDLQGEADVDWDHFLDDDDDDGPVAEGPFPFHEGVLLGPPSGSPPSEAQKADWVLEKRKAVESQLGSGESSPKRSRCPFRSRCVEFLPVSLFLPEVFCLI